MRILITGSQGLIGSALKQNLQNRGVEVEGLDINSKPDESEYGTILDQTKLIEKTRRCDGVIHLGAVSRVIFAEKDPELCWLTNVQGTHNVLNASLEVERKPWVIYASSREVYGEQSNLPVCENAPLQPINIYGESKVKAEALVQEFAKKGIQTAIVRFSNVFGRIDDHHDRVIPAFCRAAALGENIYVEGSDNVFDFTYIDDVVRGIVKLVALMERQDESIDPIHFTTGHPSSLADVARFAQQESKYSIEVIEQPSRPYDVAKFCGNPSRAKHILNWEPTFSVREGMRRLINAFIRSEEKTYA